MAQEHGMVSQQHPMTKSQRTGGTETLSVRTDTMIKMIVMIARFTINAPVSYTHLTLPTILRV